MPKQDSNFNPDNSFVQDNGDTVALRHNSTGQGEVQREVQEFATLQPKLAITKTAQDIYHVFVEMKLAPRQVAFLCSYIESCGVIHRAVVATGIHRSTHYNWIKESEIYAQAFEVAQRYANENLLAIATDRAAFGTPEPHFYKEDVVGFVVKYPESLMITLLKGRFPDMFKERQEIEDKRDKEVLRRDPGREILTDERIKAMLALADKAIAAGINPGKEKPGEGQRMIEAGIEEPKPADK